jgi:TfoX/Sxy family transcriptional regulator of competence genes
MAYNEVLSFRVQKLLIQLNIDFIEKKMFGGNAFMIKDKMCIGIVKDELMLRVLDTVYESLLEEIHVRPMDFTGKTMKGFLFIEPEALNADDKLLKWMNYGLDFAEKGIVKSKNKK